MFTNISPAFAFISVITALIVVVLVTRAKTYKGPNLTCRVRKFMSNGDIPGYVVEAKHKHGVVAVYHHGADIPPAVHVTFYGGRATVWWDKQAAHDWAKEQVRLDWEFNSRSLI